MGNTLEAVVGATLLLRIDFRPALDRVRDVFALIGLAAIVSTTIAATNGATTLLVSGQRRFDPTTGPSWLLWWLGDAMGNLVVAPLLLVLAQRPWRELDRNRLVEAGLLLALLRGGHLDRFPRRPLALSAPGLPAPRLGDSPLPPARRRRQQLRRHRLAVAGAVRGTTPIGEGSATEVAQIVEGLTGGFAISLLILGAILAERSTAGRELARTHAGLAEAQRLAHIGSWEWDVPANKVTWSEELYRLWGLEPGRKR